MGLGKNLMLLLVVEMINRSMNSNSFPSPFPLTMIHSKVKPGWALVNTF